MGWRALVLLGLVCPVLVGACRADSPAAPAGTLRVVTTVAPITSLAAMVAGDAARVEGLVPEGADSHTYEPPPRAARLLAEADVVFLNGLQLDEPARRLAEADAGTGAEIVALGEATLRPDEYIYDVSFPRAGGRPNPHLWTSPPLARKYAGVIADTLAARDPAHAAEYRANHARLAERIDDLDRAVAEVTATLPPERRKLLTYHDAYAYFARHYGWTVVGAIQPADFGEPTPRDVAGLIAQVRAEGVPAIFGSEVFPSPVLERIGRETGARYVDVLRDDDLPGGPGDPGHSWLGLMKFDVVTIVGSLGGDPAAVERVPEAGLPPDRARYPQ